MRHRSAICLYAFVSAAVLLVPASARAQFTPQTLQGPASGETYHIEGFAGFWAPSYDITFASAGSGHLAGIVGTDIDARRDLGFQDAKFSELRFVVRPAKNHKFRFDYIPISYTATSTLTRDIVFNGIRYTANIPVNSQFDWKAFRFAYEYDFLTRNQWYAGVILEAKYTDVQVQLASILATEFARARAPVPAIGGVARYYIVPNIGVTVELTGLKVPRIEDKYEAHYLDVDVYGTVNFTRNLGAQIGFRSFDVGFLVKEDTGALTMKGLYFGVVARY
jgi:hypothetical protein